MSTQLNQSSKTVLKFSESDQVCSQIDQQTSEVISEIKSGLMIDDTELQLCIQHLPIKFRDEYIVQQNNDECYLCGT